MLQDYGGVKFSVWRGTLCESNANMFFDVRGILGNCDGLTSQVGGLQEEAHHFVNYE